MSLLMLAKSRVSWATIVLAVALLLSASINGTAQILDAGQYPAAIDPLLYDVGRRSLDFRPTGARAANSLPAGRTGNLVPSGGGLDPSLNPAIDSFPGNVRSSLLLPDGKILLGGYFKNVNGADYKSLVRLNSDYSVDPTFQASANGSVLTMALQTDGKIVLAGAFTVVNGRAQNRIARLNPDGSLDNSFNTGFGADNVVNELLVQPDGKIVIGGGFTFVGTASRFAAARLNPDGSLDAGFVSPIPPASPGVIPSLVNSLALQPDGKILIGGLIVRENSFPTVTTPIARLNPNGSFDTAFNPGTINSNLYDLALQPDGKILIGGFFSLVNGVSRRYLARLTADGALDETFDAAANAIAPVLTLHLKPDGKILFSSIVLFPSEGALKQLNPNGTLDRAFVPAEAVTGQNNTILSTADDKILAGGSFSSVFTDNINSAMLFNADGSPVSSFHFTSTALGNVRAAVVQPDGKIIAAGNFTRVNGFPNNNLVRFNENGTIDGSFRFNAGSFSSSGGRITALLLEPDGKILVGGGGLITDGQSSSALVRLNPDGSPDSSFVSNVPTGRSATATLARQPDGKILVSYTISSPIGGNFHGLVRLNPDGSNDPGFTAPALQFEALAVLPDGKILAGGPTSIGYINSGTGQSDFYHGLLRLNADGTHDRTFRAGFVTDDARFTKVYALALQPDGKILAGGSLFTGSAATAAGVLRLNESGTIDGTFQQNSIASASELARVEDLELLPDGRLLVGGFFENFGGAPRRNLVRLTPAGQIDADFEAQTDAAVYDIALQEPGKIVIGGDFERVNNTARTALARLFDGPAGARRAPFDFDGDGKTDLGVFRPADGVWWINRSGTGQTVAARFGAAEDRLTPADFTGDGKADIAFFRPGSGEWFILRSDDGTFLSFAFGQNGDLPVAGDFDADGKSDPTVFRPATGEWFILKSTGGVIITTFGASGDVPVASDFDGDSKADVAIFRPSDGSCWYLRSSDGAYRVFRFGLGTDKPVAADYTGDGKTDIAVFRESTGEWFVLRSEDNSFYAVPFGQAGDVPVPGDYDGDGRSDTAVFRPSDSTWYVNRSTAGLLIAQFGSSGDRPVPAAFVP